ncbi:MAG: HAD-IA family hydrolase [Ruminococcus sp.]|nr:HAD-IA family hydrolase [Ruminococcus sp.]
MILSVIFDLDGTLANTIDDIGAACNYALGKFGMSGHTADEYKYFVGDGIKELIERALPENYRDNAEMKEACLLEFRRYYQENYCVFTKPYDGIYETLEKLKRLGISLSVVTNKNEEAVGLIIKKLFGGYFETVIGNSDRIKQKPDPESVIKIMEQNSLSKDEVLFVGDSYTDIRTAKNAGIKGVGVLWGFRTREELENEGADFIIERPEELIDIVNSL